MCCKGEGEFSRKKEVKWWKRYGKGDKEKEEEVAQEKMRKKERRKVQN